MPKTCSEKSCQFFLGFFFVLSRFRVFPTMGVQKDYQKTFYKKIVSEGFYKKIGGGNPNRFLGRFSFLGVSRHGE
jgi:hypothetical protein